MKKKNALAKAIEWFVAFFEPLPPDVRRKIIYDHKRPPTKEESVWPKDFDAKNVSKALNKQAPKLKGKEMPAKPGLYANIHKKQARIENQKAEGKPVEKMRKPGIKGAPTAAAFKQSAKTAKGK
jgi:hypothetical protein